MRHASVEAGRHARVVWRFGKKTELTGIIVKMGLMSPIFFDTTAACGFLRLRAADSDENLSALYFVGS